MRPLCLTLLVISLWLRLDPNPVSAQGVPTLAAITLDPSRVTGGAASTGAVTLSAAAPAGGAAVLLSSSDPAATVPDRLVIVPGSRSQTFSVTTRPVTSETAVTISSVYNGVIRSAVLTVLPAPALGAAGAVLEVPAPVAANGQLGSPRPPGAAAATNDTVLPEQGTGRGPGGPFEPDEGPDNSAIRRLTDDGSLFVSDSAGTALLRLRAATREILLDPTAQDPVDGVGLARLLRVETGLDGVSAVLALRADNSRGLYRLQAPAGGRSAIQRLALLPDELHLPFGDEPFAVGDAGQVAYVTSATPTSDLLALFELVRGQRVQVLGPGQVIVNSEGKVVADGSRSILFSSLQSNGAGDLAFLVYGPNGVAVLRTTAARPAAVATTGQVVLQRRGGDVTGVLTAVVRPRIGPDGAIVFLGRGSGFVNFYTARPGRGPVPLLPESDWTSTPESFDYEPGAGSMIAVRATHLSPDASKPGLPALYLAGPGGDVTPIDLGKLQPEGRPLLGGGNWLYFLARDTGLPRDSEGGHPVGLYRVRLAKGLPAGRPEAVAVPGQAIPGRPGARLFTVTRRPAVSARGLAFEARFGSPDPGAAPVTGYFQVPPDGALTGNSLLADEGALLPGGERLAIVRSLSYRADGTLVFGGLQPGAGPLVASLTPAVTAGRTRTLAVQAGIEPLLAIGQALDRPDRRLLAILSPPAALGRDQQLFGARFSQDRGPGGEGLFTIDRSRLIQAVAVTGDPVPGLSGARFAAFTDSPSASAAAALNCSPFATAVDPLALGSPGVFTDGGAGNVVFKARLEREGKSSFGVFQWTGAAVMVLGLSDPGLGQDMLGFSADDRPPYQLLRWAAGPAGRAYLMTQHRSAAGREIVRLLERSATGARPLVISGVTPVAGGSAGLLVNLLNFVLTHDGGIFVHGRGAGGEGVYQVASGRLTPVATVDGRVSRFADGRQAGDLVFRGCKSIEHDDSPSWC